MDCDHGNRDRHHPSRSPARWLGVRHGVVLPAGSAVDALALPANLAYLTGQKETRMAESSPTKSPTVSDDLAKKFATEKDTPYLRWVRGEGLDVISAQYVPNLRTVALKPWPRRGGSGVYINHDASRMSNDCYVCEIPPGKKLAPQRQLFEEMILILDGRGSTSVWNDEGKRITFEWKAGAMFAIPLNCWHQHFNGSGQEPVRYVGVTNAPAVMNLYDDDDFVFNAGYDFKGRFSGEPDYFSAKNEQSGFLLMTNFVADAVNLPLISAKERGAGGGHVRFNMAKGSMSSHISQFPVGTYKKAHCHGPSAHVIVLSGEGYSLMWQEGQEPKRYDWQVGTLIVPPNKWFHQHFNTGPTPARYLAFKHEVALIRNSQGVPTAWISRRIGGDQLDYADEKPEIRKMFSDSLAKHGMTPRMDDAYQAELADLPQKMPQREAAE
jgi:oxalate decarboxylase/phosphoglucose isomerase-like protein (cupin superfamily)